MKLYFIACPYSDPDSNVVEMRFQACTQYAAELALKGIATYSQITMTHPINQYLASQGQKVAWSEIDMEFLKRFDCSDASGMGKKRWCCCRNSILQR